MSISWKSILLFPFYGSTTRVFTFFRGHPVGEDKFGNRYYKDRTPPRPGEREKRWVVFRGLAEPSKVPAEWHGWLHHTHDTLPLTHAGKRHSWEKPHLPNLTGTPGAYVPPGHLRAGAKRSPATADYEAWKP